ncbi:unnamed protein product [Closterium sp. NIES-54]
MQANMQTMSVEVERPKKENAELHQACGAARQESPIVDEASSSSTPNEAIFSELESSMDAAEERRAQRQQSRAVPTHAPATAVATTSAAAVVPTAVTASTTVKIKPTNPPPFNPSDKFVTVSAWLFGAEVFFNAVIINDDAACINFWGAALQARFEHISASDSARMKLRAWKQLTSVQDYTNTLCNLTDQVDDMSDAERMDRYVAGLKYDIQYEVRRTRPCSFNDAV